MNDQLISENTPALEANQDCGALHCGMYFPLPLTKFLSTYVGIKHPQVSLGFRLSQNLVLGQMAPNRSISFSFSQFPKFCNGDFLTQ